MQSGALLDQHTLDRFPSLVFYLTFYVSKYHIWRKDALSDGVLCYIHLDFVSRMPNKLDISLVLPIVQTIKMQIHGFGASLNNGGFRR